MGMEWVQSFYEKQAKWSGIYWGDVLDIHREKVLMVQDFIGNNGEQVLELGAGGGQHAIALAELGYKVRAAEIVPELAQHIRDLARQRRDVEVKVIEGDFYQVEIPYQFDAVCYWDGFGVGTDDDQRQLLKKIAKWLKKGGYAFVDVYTPWHAAKSSGYRTRVGKALRQYEFDAEQCRWLDHWWLEGEGKQKIMQSLRCYSPADLRLLLEGNGLEVVKTISGGMMDYEQGRFLSKASLHEAMWYLAVLKHRT
ncbi:N-methyl-transferase-related protein [hydrothermal vent metagenome]|uniref:N-methyl-transferase-related protein n=1 Tax=hydrothermal vent metagenome TaxID=652676 RepID=A0A3B0VHQ6_9ZZZZ